MDYFFEEAWIGSGVGRFERHRGFRKKLYRSVFNSVTL